MTFPTTLPLWLWRPNWRDDVISEFNFQTEVLKSRNGQEKRQANRNTPRRSLTFTVTRKADDAKDITRFVGKNVSAEIAMPDYTRAVEVPDNVAETQDVFELSSIPYWLTAGEPYIFADRENQALLTVESIDGNEITLSAGVPFALPAGRGKVIPPVRGLLRQPVALDIKTDQVLEGGITLDVTPASEAERDYSYAGATLNGREVFEFNPNYASGFNRETEKPLDRIDFGRGKIEWFDPITNVADTRQVEFLLRTQSEIDSFLGYFFRARGQQGEMYVPSWEDDMTLALDAVSGATAIRASGLGVYSSHAGDLTRRAVEIRLFDGRIIRRRVSAISAVSGNSNLTLTSGLPYDLNREDVMRFSWLHCSRFATDTLTLAYKTDQVAVARTSFVTLPDLTPE